MKILSPRFADYIHVGAGVSGEGSVVLAGLNLKLFDGVGVGNRDSSGELRATLQVVDSYAVHLEIVVQYRSSVGDEPRAG